MEKIDLSTLPSEIGKYKLDEINSHQPDDLYIGYSSEDRGYFTIFIYKYQNETVPEVLNEFENCITEIFNLETEGYYQNVELIARYLISDENEKDIFHSAELKLTRPDELESETSYLFLRFDAGYFHKIRFSVSSESADDVKSDMEDFLIKWGRVLLRWS